MNQAFHMLSSRWKSIAYSNALAKYVDALLTRMTSFFCMDMPGSVMDDEKLRQPIPRKSDRFAPNHKFALMCQIRFCHFLSDLEAYKNVRKANLREGLKKILIAIEERERIAGGTANLSVSSKKWLNCNLLRNHCEETAKSVLVEQRTSAANRFVFMSYCEADREWLYNEETLPSMDDEFVAREVLDIGYRMVVEKNARPYDAMLKEDFTNLALLGYYEWCVLKNISRAFVQNFTMFVTDVVHREELANVETLLGMFQKSGPTLVQFFSEYGVFYEGEFYCHPPVDDICNRGEGEEGETSDEAGMRIYESLLFWICINVYYFPTNKRAMALKKSLKIVYTEEELKKRAKLTKTRTTSVREARNEDDDEEDDDDRSFDGGDQDAYYRALVGQSGGDGRKKRKGDTTREGARSPEREEDDDDDVEQCNLFFF